MKFSAFRLSSPHLEPHSMGRLRSTRPRQDCLSSFVHRQGLARPPASPAALALALHESARKSIIFSQAAGQSITDVCTTFMFSGFFYMRRVSQSTHSSCLDRKCQRRHWLCHLTDSHVRHSVTQQSSVPPMASVIPQQLARQLLYCISYRFCFALPLISE